VLIFFEVWAAVATVLAVFFWSERRAAEGMVAFLLLFMQERTKHTPKEVADFAEELRLNN
jgi:hypothetical protein